jgi:hypothetical protein
MRWITRAAWKTLVVGFFLMAVDNDGIQAGSETKGPLVTPHKPATVRTEAMGGVPVPSEEELLEMHRGNHILHARRGKLVKIPVEKTLLPADRGDVQHVSAVKAPDGTVYVRRLDHICKSVDGGRNWTAYAFAPVPEGAPFAGSRFEILSDRTFIGVTGTGESTKRKEPLIVMTSTDEGRSWQKLSEFDIPDRYKPYLGKYADGLHRLSDGTLLCPIDVRMASADPELYMSSGEEPIPMEQWTALCYRSTDKGKTWQQPSTICHWWAGAEGGVIDTASGKALAVIRYQRPLLPTDPKDLVDKNGGYKGWPYKNVFLADSLDGGQTWQDFRPLCTRFGQTRGYPAALSDGTVVVIHDTRYGPGGPGSRAMISRDEGRTWQDEVYYLDYSHAPGSYNASVVLDDDIILTIVASTKPGEGHWDPAHMTAIRWKPVKD